MRNKEKDAAQIAAKKIAIMKESFKLFSEHGIEAVTMPQIADASGVARASIYRYYATKLDLVVAISTLVWEKNTIEARDKVRAASMTAAEQYEFFLQNFIDLYREHSDILRFNQFFNVYLANHKPNAEVIEPFTQVIKSLEGMFHNMYSKGREDGTLKTDISENEMFSSSLHLMLAAVTRYAIGLVYNDGVDPEHELLLLKDMLMERYTQKN